MPAQRIYINRSVADKIIRKHNVSVEEVSEVLCNSEYPLHIRGSPKGRHRYLAMGQTDAGRYLTIAFVKSESNICKVLTAREMTDPERRWYRRR